MKSMLKVEADYGMAHWIVEEKLDGSSMTVGIRFNPDDGVLETHVCSRNLSLKLEDESSSFVRMAKASKVLEALTELGMNIAVQGELVGEGIQGNRYKIQGQHWYIFNIYLVDEGRYASVLERLRILESLYDLGLDESLVKKIPSVDRRILTGLSVDEILKMAEGKSLIEPTAEREGDVSFKAISNRFLMKGGD